MNQQKARRITRRQRGTTEPYKVIRICRRRGMLSDSHVSRVGRTDDGWGLNEFALCRGKTPTRSGFSWVSSGHWTGIDSDQSAAGPSRGDGALHDVVGSGLSNPPSSLLQLWEAVETPAMQATNLDEPAVAQGHRQARIHDSITRSQRCANRSINSSAVARQKARALGCGLRWKADSYPRSGPQTRSGPKMAGVEPRCLVELFANRIHRNPHAARALRHKAGFSSAPKVRHVCCFFGVVPVSCFSSKFGGV